MTSLRFCPWCGASAASAWSFCASCGQPLALAASKPKSPPPPCTDKKIYYPPGTRVYVYLPLRNGAGVGGVVRRVCNTPEGALYDVELDKPMDGYVQPGWVQVSAAVLCHL